MKRSLAVVFVAVVAFWDPADLIRAQDGAAPPLDPRILAYDRGPAKIDVSEYPADVQGAYKVFQRKCGTCHPLARTINCEFVLDDEWDACIKTMMQKAGTLISPEDGRQILAFLTYDSKVRKKALYDSRQAEAIKAQR